MLITGTNTCKVEKERVRKKARYGGREKGRVRGGEGEKNVKESEGETDGVKRESEREKGK